MHPIWAAHPRTHLSTEYPPRARTPLVTFPKKWPKLNILPKKYCFQPFQRVISTVWMFAYIPYNIYDYI